MAFEPVTITDDNDAVVIRCNRCNAQDRTTYETTAGLLGAVEMFLNAHSECVVNVSQLDGQGAGSRQA